MATAKNKQHRILSDLRNEGQSLPIEISKGEDGQLHYRANLELAGAPAEVFAADTVDIVHKEDSYRLAFSMSKRYGDGARAMVEVLLSEAAGVNFGRSLVDMAIAPIADPYQLKPLQHEPDDSVSVVANFVKISTNELGTVLDFYFVSPMSMENAAKTEHLQYKDVVRISTLPGIFYAVVEFFRGVA